MSIIDNIRQYLDLYFSPEFTNLLFFEKVDDSIWNNPIVQDEFPPCDESKIDTFQTISIKLGPVSNRKMIVCLRSRLHKKYMNTSTSLVYLLSINDEMIKYLGGSSVPSLIPTYLDQYLVKLDKTPLIDDNNSSI